MFEPTRGGTRGGQAEFKWSDVSADKDRENYLGHSINAPTGRWQKNKDVHWYNREGGQTDAEREEEIRAIKEKEAEALSLALGFAPSKTALPSSSAPGTGANAAPLPPKAPSSPNASLNPEAAEAKEEKRRRKAEKQARKEEKRARKEEKKARRAEREGSRGHGGSKRYDSDESDDEELGRRRGYRDERERSPVPVRRYRDERSRSPRRRGEREQYRVGRYRERSRSPVASSRAPRDYDERDREKERDEAKRRGDERDRGRGRGGRE
ncbi:uncharacterized protein STEHIDRAFT_172052 [Stereum hirsutum FP-91666 SS1]|uniref:uncharacterized protein n=1 Tax=Stereum hirsutum (strain FP-91666) TaxID=721885 RepID=UPI000444A2BA|nr:uncharacterized protein STEHIDRAFT_172052 [Stereum hirsutum FP-91666 SS1]EIM80984.1 hypothetical protein STEHIDRAFT_172052 [Stereum hirsutum FP-91666 SS1]